MSNAHDTFDDLNSLEQSTKTSDRRQPARDKQALAKWLMTNILSLTLFICLCFSIISVVIMPNMMPKALADDNFDTSLLNDIEPSSSYNSRQSNTKRSQLDKRLFNNPVVDSRNFLSPSEKSKIGKRLHNMYQQGLAQAALVIVPTTDGMPIFDYSMQIAETWKLGDAHTDDGLLIVVAVNDRDMYILTGYGLEGALPDGAVGSIIRNDITPRFKQNDYAGGILAGIDRIEYRLTTDPETLAQADKLEEQRNNTSLAMDDETSGILFILLCAGTLFGKILSAIFGRGLGATIIAGGAFAISMFLGINLPLSICIAIVLWFLLMSGIEIWGGSDRRYSSSTWDYDSDWDDHDSWSSGSSSSGGFSSGGYDGGGGDFGGGGAGGSW